MLVISNKVVQPPITEVTEVGALGSPVIMVLVLPLAHLTNL